jgi:hypothetical protein
MKDTTPFEKLLASYEVKCILTTQATTPLLDIYPWEMKIYVR